MVGDTSGIAPGYRGSLGWWELEFASEGEYVFDTRDFSGSFWCILEVCGRWVQRDAKQRPVLPRYGRFRYRAKCMASPTGMRVVGP